MDNPLDRAIAAASDPGRRISGLQHVASVCGVKYQFIQKMRRIWRETGQPPAAMLSHAPGIEAACGGAVRADDLYPDVKWERDQVGQIVGYRVPVKPAKAA